jgi:hypothetical protein
VKRTGRDEPIGFVNIYGNNTRKLPAKTPWFFFYLFFSTKLENRRTEEAGV